jgi:aminopeptidase N
VRSLISAFANSNLPQFHAIDGRGYQLVTDVIIAVDKINPQVRQSQSSFASAYVYI